MTTEKEVDDARNIRDAGVKDKRKESQPSSSSSGKKHRTCTPQWFQGQGRGYQGQGQGIDNPRVGYTSRLQARQGRGHVSIAISLDI